MLRNSDVFISVPQYLCHNNNRQKKHCSLKIEYNFLNGATN